jgi:hypothetical protein
VLNNWDNEEDLAMLHALGRHGQAHRIDDFMAQGERCGWCACPIRLRGYVLDQDRRVVFSSHGFPTPWYSDAARCSKTRWIRSVSFRIRSLCKLWERRRSSSACVRLGCVLVPEQSCRRGTDTKLDWRLLPWSGA